MFKESKGQGDRHLAREGDSPPAVDESRAGWTARGPAHRSKQFRFHPMNDGKAAPGLEQRSDTIWSVFVLCRLWLPWGGEAVGGQDKQPLGDTAAVQGQRLGAEGRTSLEGEYPRRAPGLAQRSARRRGCRPGSGSSHRAGAGTVRWAGQAVMRGQTDVLGSGGAVSSV